VARSNERRRARQNNADLGELARLRIDFYRPRMLLHDDVVSNGQAKASALSSRFGCEEGIEHLLLNLRRNAGAVITNYDLYPVTQAFRACYQLRLEVMVSRLSLRLVAA
jgi:hypothetical protein